MFYTFCYNNTAIRNCFGHGIVSTLSATFRAVSVLWTCTLPVLKIMALLSHNPFILCQSLALQSGPISPFHLHRAIHKPLIPVLQYRHQRVCSLEINLFGNLSEVTKRPTPPPYLLLERNSVLIDFQMKRDLWVASEGHMLVLWYTVSKPPLKKRHYHTVT
jgi:hypothetical protein